MTPESPFTSVFSSRSFVETANGGDLLRRLDEALGSREPFLLVTGESGTGKTTLACEAVARWGSQVAAAFVAFPALSGDEMLEEICRRFGADPPEGAGRSKLLACLEKALGEIASSGRVALLVLDDAHSLPAERLEELRLLVNAAQQGQRTLEVLLVGLPALEARLEEPSLVALRERIAVRARLEPLSLGETRRYLHHRVTVAGGDGPGLFPRKTCREITDRTDGVPRRINALASEAMRLARAANEAMVSVDHVKAAAATLGGRYAEVRTPPRDDERSEEATRAPAAAAGSAAAVAAPRVAAPPAASPPATPARATAPASKPATKPAPASATKSAPAPVAKSEPTPAAPRAAAPAPRAAEAFDWAPPPEATPPSHHDPNEWVKRFVGDQGPVRLGSRAMIEPAWAEDLPPAKESEEIEEGGFRKPRRPAPQGSTRPRARRSHLPVLTAALVAVLGIAAAVVFVPRLTERLTPKPDAAPAVAPPPAPPDTAQAAVVAPDEEAAVPAASEPEPAPESAPAEESPSPSGPFTLEVASGLDFQQAVDQRTQLQTLSGIEGWVVPAGGGKSGEYRVVLGIFSTYERASKAAGMLVKTQTLAGASVVSLPPKRTRQ